MIKSPVITATSIIIGILSITSTVNANQRISRKDNVIQSCKNPVNSNSQYNQLAKKDINFKRDMEIICQLIGDQFTKYSKSNMEEQLGIPTSNAVTGNTTGSEVVSIKVIDLHRDNERKTATMNVEVKVVWRKYSWDRAKDKDKWNIIKTENLTNNLQFTMKDGTWEGR